MTTRVGRLHSRLRLFLILSVAAVLLALFILGVQNYEPARDELKTQIRSNNDFDYYLAKRESLGFFDDIPSRTWDRMKAKVKDMSPNFNKFYLPFNEGRGHTRVKKPGTFYQNNYETLSVSMSGELVV